MLSCESGMSSPLLVGDPTRHHVRFGLAPALQHFEEFGALGRGKLADSGAGSGIEMACS